jgi:hypothetical protein
MDKYGTTFLRRNYLRASLLTGSGVFLANTTVGLPTFFRFTNEGGMSAGDRNRLLLFAAVVAIPAKTALFGLGCGAYLSYVFGYLPLKTDMAASTEVQFAHMPMTFQWRLNSFLNEAVPMSMWAFHNPDGSLRYPLPFFNNAGALITTDGDDDLKCPGTALLEAD